MSSGTRGAPPAWAEGLLEAAVPIGVVGESIRGDLETEYLELRGPDWIADLCGSFVSTRRRTSFGSWEERPPWDALSAPMKGARAAQGSPS
jgi:hypothetical protein